MPRQKRVFFLRRNRKINIKDIHYNLAIFYYCFFFFIKFNNLKKLCVFELLVRLPLELNFC
jgi:hypothetical protein